MEIDLRDADVKTRLRSAAVELFGERGYDGTTAAAIAARAGVTERTFFRHFADKREVLFDGEAVLREAFTASIAAAPAGLEPLEVLLRAFAAFAPEMEGNRAYSEPRQRIIAATPALQERELAKVAALAESLAQALQARGVPELRATLAARSGMAAFVEATLAWLRDPSASLAARIGDAGRELRLALAAS